MLRRVRAELDTTSSSHADVLRLEYLDAVVKESMRLHSVVPNGSVRIVTDPLELGPYTLPPRTVVSVLIHCLHRNPKLYPRPNEFDPDRFLGVKPNPYEWIPFGGGIRRCLGMSLAMQEIKLIARQVLTRANLELVDPEVRPVRRGAFVAPENGVRVRMTGRRN